MTTLELLNKEFEAIREDLVSRHDDLGMRASGKWVNSLEVKTYKKDGSFIARLLGENYTEQLVFGRKPGSFPPISAIKKWIQDKGIQPLSKEITTSSLAFLIARKIAKEGTRYYRQGGTDLVSSVITPERIDRIISQVDELNVEIFTRGLINKLKQLA